LENDEQQIILAP